MAHVQTVLGPIDPAELGFTLPHEHTQIALWQIPDRWDYWQLTRDQPLILDELGQRLAPLATTEARLRAAIDYYVETIDEFDGAPGQTPLVSAWAEADAEPGLRDMLVRRRERLVGAATLLLQEGIARGDLPSWLDVDGFARGFVGLLDGLILQRIEAGDGYRPEESVRRTRAVLDVLLAAARVEQRVTATA